MPPASSAAAVAGPRPAKDSKAIWDDDEVKARDDLPDEDGSSDGRKVPVVEILYKQAVTSEDLYLGMSGKTPSSTNCEAMVYRISLPGERVADIDLDVKTQGIVLRSPHFKLISYLPHPVRAAECKAQWDARTCVLSVTMPVVRKEVWEQT